MRHLILFRHAKALAATAGDHARPLSQRGLEEAAQAGLALAARLRPELALVSDAQRTRETFGCIAEAAGLDIPHRFDHSLYGADPQEIASVVAGVDASIERLLVIGHNPGLGDLARRLSQGGDADLRDRLAASFPTSAFAIIALDWTGWSDDTSGTLQDFVTVDSNAGSD